MYDEANGMYIAGVMGGDVINIVSVTGSIGCSVMGGGVVCDGW